MTYDIEIEREELQELNYEVILTPGVDIEEIYILERIIQ